MLVKNYAKPFAIAGIILAEIYMLLVVLAPPGHEVHRMLAEVPVHPTMAPYSEIPVSHMIGRVLVCSIFFGPFGGLVGMGVGLIFSAVLQWWRNRGQRPAVESPQ